MTEVNSLMQDESRRLTVKLYSDELEKLRANAAARRQTLEYHLRYWIIHWLATCNRVTEGYSQERAASSQIFAGSHEGPRGNKDASLLINLTLSRDTWAQLETLEKRLHCFKLENIAEVVSKLSC